VFGEIFGRAPANMSGDLEAANRSIFQKEFARLREAHPEWSNEAIANEAVKATPFAKNRITAGYGDFSVTASDYANVSPELQNVPTRIRVEALPTREHPPPNLPPGPVPVPTVPPRDEE
jgi:hypothetical protein